VKRFIVSVMLGVAALGGACTQQAATTLSAGLSGTYDLTLVGAQVFVTSAARNELRVLELTEDATLRRFARAPNPLEPLAIPVLPRPQALAHDVRYDADGVEQAGPYVYARSSGSSLISVVSVAELREVRRLDAQQLTAALAQPALGPITALAALAPAIEGAPSTLYFATQETSGSRLWRVLLPSSADALEGFEGTFEVKGFGPVTTPLAATEAVSSLVVLPQAGSLAVSTLRGERGNPGRSFVLEPEGSGAERVLDFGGAQVLQLATHGRINGDEGQPVRLAEGARIFGLLDPSNCVTQPCASGVLAVTADTGTLAKDPSGYPMLVINSGSGLPMGLSLSTSTKLSVQAGEDRSSGSVRDSTLPLLGIVPLSTGGLLFFDALNLTQINTAASWAEGQPVNTVTATLSRVDVVGNVVDASEDLTFEGTYGTTRDETYVLTYQGALPGMTALTRDPESATFTVPALTEANGTPAVRPGDRIVLVADLAGQQACGTDLVVAEVRAAPTAGQSVLVPSGTLPEECAGFGYFQVRVAGVQPLLLSGPGEGYIQRLGTGDVFSRSKSYFFHPPGYQGQTEATAVRLRVVRNLEDTNRPLARGDRYVVAASSHFYPYLITVDIATYQDLQSFRLPGPVVRARVGDTDYAYIVYPSANGVLQVTLTSLLVGTPNSQGLATFR
jgi:hypothetical protein